ncbi:FtsX-like permease family protein [Parabacteroides bouchesdurhonensis]|uniref:FtsX-like permease family protein n=2 Tax=Parabacteroides bouchesdurhonensis TaxID=1936995 RepID=UPI000E4DE3D3|nr:FtsX-like permease family protein [Parabacteroides bouchesdurhonensis]RHJ92430.1 cell division protein FtsX [Bacteroides sp. AM07-16]
MILHILKLIKTNLYGNIWVLVELLVVFVVLWFTTDYFLMRGILANRPVGFDVENVYKVTLSMRPANAPSFVKYEDGSDEPRQNLYRIVDRIKAHPDVEAVCMSYVALPYTFSNWGIDIYHDSIHVSARSLNVTPEYFKVFDIHPASGGSAEELARRLPEGAIVSATTAQELFGRTDVAGERYYSMDSIGEPIIAVSEPLRNDEYATSGNIQLFGLLDERFIDAFRLDERSLSYMDICFRTCRGVNPQGFAERFMKETKQSLTAGNYWVSEVKPYTEIRASFLDNSLGTSGQKVLSIISGFFLVNVFLAVIGTFWFRVNRRRAELGLRMAVGSTHRGIRGLMIGEGLMLLFLASVPALLVCGNLAYMEILSTDVMPVSVWRFAVVSLLAWLALAFVIIAACWYPSQRAARMAPAEALHYE